MQKWLYFISSLGAVVLLIVYHQLNEVPVDSGDGLAHFFIAQHVFSEPIELLNHWGKPLFTLFSAPFAYFGFQVYVYFNILIFALSLFLAHRLFQHYKIDPKISALFPMLLLAAPDYASNVLGGMTEVLFGFLVLLSGYLVLKKHWLWFALLVSFMPFARSEGQLMLPLALLVLLYNKQFKVLPLLGFGFLIYALIGFFALGDFWWYFTQNPYQGAAEIYGQGDWLHYVFNWHLHLGLPGLIVLVLAFLVFFWLLFKKKITREQAAIVLYFGFIYFGIVLVHAYLWANGKSGALGLSRLAIHGLPGLLVACLLVLSWTNTKSWFTYSLAIPLFLVSVLCIRDYPWVYDQLFPKKAMPDERAVLDATDATLRYLQNQDVGRVYYYHPLVAYKSGYNLKAKDEKFVQKSFAFFEEDYAQLNNGDLIIWDSHFAGRDMNFPEELTTRFEELYVFTPFNQMVHKGDAVAHVKVLRVNKAKKNTFISHQKIVDSTLQIAADSLYTNLPRINNTGQTETYQLQITNRSANGGQLYFVVQHDISGQALTFELDNVNTWKFSLPSNLLGEYKVFVHNPEGVIGEIEVSLGIEMMRMEK